MSMTGKKIGKERRRLKKLIIKEQRGEVPEGTSDNSRISWESNAARGNTFFQIQRMRQYHAQLKGETEYGYRAGASA